MAKLIFRLRNVPDDEADAVRQLLDNHGVDWYETGAGNWGIAMPGIWIKDDSQALHARTIINQYQKQRQAEQREIYLKKFKTHEAPTLANQFLLKPVETIGVIAFCLFILYVMINPFLKLAGVR